MATSSMDKGLYAAPLAIGEICLKILLRNTWEKVIILVADVLEWQGESHGMNQVLL